MSEIFVDISDLETYETVNAANNVVDSYELKYNDKKNYQTNILGGQPRIVTLSPKPYITPTSPAPVMYNQQPEKQTAVRIGDALRSMQRSVGTVKDVIGGTQTQFKKNMRENRLQMLDSFKAATKRRRI